MSKASNTIDCKFCGRPFKDNTLLSVHLTRSSKCSKMNRGKKCVVELVPELNIKVESVITVDSHKTNSKPDADNYVDDEVQQQQEEEEQGEEEEDADAAPLIPCPYCGCLFKDKEVVNIHLERSSKCIGKTGTKAAIKSPQTQEAANPSESLSPNQLASPDSPDTTNDNGTAKVDIDQTEEHYDQIFSCYQCGDVFESVIGLENHQESNRACHVMYERNPRTRAQFIKISRDMKRDANGVFTKTTDKIIKWLNDNDEKFRWRKLNSGSSFENLKVF